MYIVNCGMERSSTDTHRFCLICIRDMIGLKIQKKELITCPYRGCQYILKAKDLEEIWFDDDVCQDYDRMLLLSNLENVKGFVTCTTPDCNWFALSPELDRIVVNCPKCNAQFCNICRREYHYRSECNEVMGYMEQWVNWQRRGRRKYLNKKKEILNGFNLEVKEYEIALQQNRKENNDLVERFKILQQDENHKVQHCRLCPNCNRIVEKLDGCDLMVCGHNFHGGNSQHGCGKSFNWSGARPYQSQSQQGPRREEFSMTKPELVLKKHENDLCEICNNTIVGLRFECLNCTYFNVCELCESNLQELHISTHIFKIIGLG